MLFEKAVFRLPFIGQDKSNFFIFFRFSRLLTVVE